MAIRLQNQGVAGVKHTTVRHYHAGAAQNAAVSIFSTAPAPKAVDRSKNCAGTTKSGKPCGAFHTDGSKFCVNHEPTPEAPQPVTEVTDEPADAS